MCFMLRFYVVMIYALNKHIIRLVSNTIQKKEGEGGLVQLLNLYSPFSEAFNFLQIELLPIIWKTDFRLQDS